MSDFTSTMPVALRRALELIAEPPTRPDTTRGYLDLADVRPDIEQPPTNTGWVQGFWSSRIGATLYDRLQAVAASRRLFAAFYYTRIDWLKIPQGGIALDIGCGPGNVTSALARAAGPAGLALGIDLSEPMLARAVRAESGPNVGFLRADAQRLPFRDNTVDAIVSIAALQLIPEPHLALAEAARVLRPGGRLIVGVPTTGRVARSLARLIPQAGAHAFGHDELGGMLEHVGFVSVQTDNLATYQWVRGRVP